MKNILTLFILLIVVLCPWISEAKERYIQSSSNCALNGDGTSPLCATSAGGTGSYNTPSAIDWSVSTGLRAGDTLFICGTITQPIAPPSNVAGNAQNTLKLSFACPGNPGRIIQFAYFPSATLDESWTLESTNVWYYSLAVYPNKPFRVWINRAEQAEANVKTLLGTQSGNGPFRVWFYDFATKRLYFYSRVNPAKNIQELRTNSSTNGACTYAGICLNVTHSYIDIVNPVIQGGAIGSIYVAGSSHIRVYGEEPGRCNLGGFAPRGIFMGDSTVNGMGTPATFNEVWNCTIDPLASPGYDEYVDERVNYIGDGIALLQGASDNYFHDLKISNWPHAMVMLVGNTGSALLENNRFEYIDYHCDDYVEYCRAIGVSGNSINRVSNNVFKNSRISNMAVRSQINGNGNIVEGNYITSQRIGTVVRAGGPIAQVFEFEAAGGPSQDNVIRGNVFFSNNVGPCVSFRPNASTLSGHIVEKNVFINCGGADGNYTALVMPTHPNLGTNFIRDNIFIGSQTVSYRDLGKTTVAAFQAACVIDVCTGNYEVQLPPFSVSTDKGCLLGYTWEMGGHRAREIVCIRRETSP